MKKWKTRQISVKVEILTISNKKVTNMTVSNEKVANAIDLREGGNLQKIRMKKWET